MMLLFMVLLARSRWKRFQPIFSLRQTSARGDSSHDDKCASSRLRKKPELARRYAMARSTSLSLGALATNDCASAAAAAHCRTARLFRNASTISSRAGSKKFRMLVSRIISQAGERFGHRRFQFSAHVNSGKHKAPKATQAAIRLRPAQVSRGAMDSREDIDGLTRTVFPALYPAPGAAT